MIDHYTADVLSAQDYYPFGMLQPGRTWNGGSYRYGFNGKENDNEPKGLGTLQDYGMRIYDPRLGKFLSVDPLEKKFPYWTPYQFSGNNPIRFIDLDGAEILDPLTRWFATDAAVTLIQRPNSAKAKVYGVAIGVGGSINGAVQGAGNLVRNPKEASKGLLRMATNTPMQNALDYAITMAQTYGDLPEPVQGYAIGAHFFTDLGVTIAPFKGPIKNSAIKLSAELPPGTRLAGASFRNAGELKVIGLGVEQDLIAHKGSNAVTYKNAGWQNSGLTRVDWGRASMDTYYFKESFKEAAKNANAINFDVTNFNPSYTKSSITKFEFEHIINNPSLLEKTTFTQGGKAVTWDGNTFIPKK